MMNKKIDYIDIVRYLKGDCNKNEQEIIHDWLNDSRNVKLYKEILFIWEFGTAPDICFPDIESAYNKVLKEIEKRSIKRKHFKRTLSVYIKIAACIIIISGILASIFFSIQNFIK